MVCSPCCLTIPCTASKAEAVPIGRRSQGGSRSAGEMALYRLPGLLMAGLRTVGGGLLHLAPALKGPGQGDFVGIFQLAAHR